MEGDDDARTIINSSMIVYNVTVNVEDSVHEEWLAWMKDVHIPDVMRTGMFLENRVLKLLQEEETGGVTYAVQYHCESIEKFNQYEKDFAPALRAEHNAKFKDKFVAFRTLLERVS
jgi:hypothetical protein